MTSKILKMTPRVYLFVFMYVGTICVRVQAFCVEPMGQSQVLKSHSSWLFFFVFFFFFFF